MLGRSRWNGALARTSSTERRQSIVLEIDRDVRRNFRKYRSKSGGTTTAATMTPVIGVSQVTSATPVVESIP